MAETPENLILKQHGAHKKTGKPHSFKCPNCTGMVNIKALGHSITAVCAYCSSVIDVANDNYRILQTYHEKTRPTLLSIGSKAALFGIIWEVIGYVEKQDHTDYNRWDEYLLYNPYHGFRYLQNSNGHWTLYKVLKQSLGNQALGTEIRLNGQKYELFLKGFAKVAYVKGEFYWRVQKGERERVYDYIAPPQLLSVVVTDDEINLALGTYIPAKTIAKSFNIELMPYQSGIAPNQVGKYNRNDVWKVWLTSALAIALAVMLQMALQGSNKSSALINQSFEINPGNQATTISTDSFNIPKQTSLSIDSSAPLNNDWLELDYALVNDKDEEIRAAKQAVEYYSGIEDGYHWAEGNSTAETLFSAVPAGNYRLLIDAESGSLQHGNTTGFFLTVKRGVSGWSNFWWTLLLILSYPLYVSIRYKFTEWRRWSESDLPYDAPKEDED